MNRSLSNFHQRARAILQLPPTGCYGENCGCEPGHIFECSTCQRLVPWCRGASDGMPDSCDDCWVLAQQMQAAAGIVGDVAVSGEGV